MRFDLHNGRKIELTNWEMKVICDAYLKECCRSFIDSELGYATDKKYNESVKDELADRVLNDIISQIYGDTMVLSFHNRVAEMDEEIADTESEDQDIDPLDQIKKKADELGWNVDFYSEKRRDGEIENIAEFSQYSPAGEDFFFSVFYIDAENLVEEISNYAHDFDVDEHAMMFVESCGRRGVPSLSVLVEDANDIEEMLDELSGELWALDLNVD